MQWTGEWGISKMKSKLPHKEITPKLLRGKKYITWKEGYKNILSFFFLSETTISGKEHKIKVFFREGTAGMEAVPALVSSSDSPWEGACPVQMLFLISKALKD